MKSAEVVTIPAEKGVPKVEIRRDAGKKPQKAAGKTTAKAAAGKKPARTVIVGDEWAEEPQKKRTNDEGVKKKSAAARAGTGNSTTGKAKRAKAKSPNEKLTPSSIFAKMLKFGKAYQIEGEQDFLEAARIFADEAGLIDQMRDQIAEEGLTVMKTYKTGDVPVAHPLLSELPRHVESANKCLATIGSMISERGAKKQKAARDLDAFRLSR